MNFNEDTLFNAMEKYGLANDKFADVVKEYERLQTRKESL